MRSEQLKQKTLEATPLYESSTTGIMERWNDGKMGYGKLEEWFIEKILFAKKFINDKFIMKIIIPIFHYSRNA